MTCKWPLALLLLGLAPAVLPAYEWVAVPPNSLADAQPAAGSAAWPEAGSSAATPQALAGTYSQAAAVRSEFSTFWLSATGAAITHTFDGAPESAGGNFFGSQGGTLQVSESQTDLGGGLTRYAIGLQAVDADGFGEPWVDSSWAGSGLLQWRLDIGTGAADPDGLDFAAPQSVVNSGFNAYASDGSLLGTFVLNDTSSALSLSGRAELSNSGADIAGIDVSSIQVFWDVTEAAPTDLATTIVDAPNGVFLPGAYLGVLVGFQNLGTIESAPSTFNVYLSSDTTITAEDTQIGTTFNVPALQPGQQLLGTAGVNLPADHPNGDYFVGVILQHADTQMANNVNFDGTPISVSDQPGISVQPLELQFSEAGPEPGLLFGNTALASAQQEATLERYPGMLEKAQREDSIRVIVGLNLPHRPEGLLTAAARLAQRDAVRRAAQRVLDQLSRFTHQTLARYRYIPYIALEVDAAGLQQLLRMKEVVSIEEDAIAAPTLANSNPVIGTPLAWAEGFDGDGTAIAILDTGVDKTHPWFTADGVKVVSEGCWSSNTAGSTSVCPGGVTATTAEDSGLPCDTAVMPGCFHGTHVAGIAAGNDGIGPDFGVARGADIIAMQVFSQFSSAATCSPSPAPCELSYTSDQISALERVYELRNSFDIAAVNMSLGGGRFYDQASCDVANASRKAAIDNLRSVGIATVISAGNEGYTDSIGAPGCISSAISVGATTNADAVAAFSNVYPDLHLLAPGVSILSSIPEGAVGPASGTSMAAPHVAGAIAVLKQKSPAATVAALLSSLQDTATSVDDLRAGGVELGMSRINLDLALGQPRTTFAIRNSGPATLEISSIAPETPAPWLDWSPKAPLSLPPGELLVVSVSADFNQAPSGTTTSSRLLIHSNDADRTPFPGGVFVEVTTLPEQPPEFDSIPAAGSTLDFGEQSLGTSSPSQSITVSNLGDQALTLVCSINGDAQASFALLACPTPVPGQGSAIVQVQCAPQVMGNLQATLNLATNDGDESEIGFALSCTGTDAPPPSHIFSNGFEQPSQGM